MSASSDSAVRKSPFSIAARILLVALLTLAALEGLLRITSLIVSVKQRVLQKPAATSSRRVLCIGDSFVYGVGGEPFPAQLEKILNEKQTGLKFQVYNAGVPGNGTGQVLNALPDQLRQYSPDYLIILAGTNNKGLYFTLSARNGHFNQLAHLKVWRLWQLLRTIPEQTVAEAPLQAEQAGQPRLRPDDESTLSALEQDWISGNIMDIVGLAYGAPDATPALRLYALKSEEQFLLLRKHIERDDTAAAARVLEKLLSSQPELPPKSSPAEARLAARMRETVRFRAASELGHLYNEIDGRKAIAAFKKAVALRPDYVSGYYQIANIYRISGDSDNFLKYINLVIKKAPDFTPAYMELCWHYYLNRQERRSVDYLYEALRRDPFSKDLITRSPYRFAELKQYLPELEERIPQIKSNPTYFQYKKLVETSDDSHLQNEITAINKEIKLDLLAAGKLAARHKARLIISSYPQHSLFPAEEAARQLGAAYINFVPLFRKRFRDEKDYLAFDNVHCNSAGYRLMAERLAEEILSAEAAAPR